MWSRCRTAAVGLLLLHPLASAACDWPDRFKCMNDVGQLVSYRSEAIEYAFGNVFGALPGKIEIRFTGPGIAISAAALTTSTGLPLASL